MNIVLINVPLREPESPNQWIPLPPKGYGGIQWVVTNLLEGYLDLGHQVWLLGAPSTQLKHRRLVVVDAAAPNDIHHWLKAHVQALKIDVIHDHSNGVFYGEGLDLTCPVFTTHHLTGRPKKTAYPIYLSEAQREQAGDKNTPVIRIPVNTKHYIYSESKEDFLLYLGRVSLWKGVYEAAQFAHESGLKLVIAGPAWEKEYLDKIVVDFSKNVEFIGEIGGKRRLQLLSRAKAVMALSQSVLGPWGDVWCEPGSTVVSEAAASGTVVIASKNGCLKEIVPKVGVTLDENQLLSKDFCKTLVSRLPSSSLVFETAVREWNYLKIANQYLEYFKAARAFSTIRPEIAIPIAHLKEQLLIEGATVVPAALKPDLMTKVDQVTRSLLENWEHLKDSDKDFWWYLDEQKGKNILYRIHNLEKKDPVFSEMIQDPTVQELRDLIFGRPTRATAFALIYKPPGGSGPVKWHRDPINVPPNTVYNFSFYLDESDLRNGALEIVPRSHLSKAIPLAQETENAKTIGAHPGDVTIHDVCVYHGSAGPSDPRMRRSVVIEFQPQEGI